MRDHYELSQIDQPASVGALEYPNAYNASTGSLTVPTPGQDAADIDALSILDGERWLTNWLEGRRMWDLHRWNHPFLVDGIVFWDVEAGGRVSCYPVPEQECQLTRPSWAPRSRRDSATRRRRADELRRSGRAPACPPEGKERVAPAGPGRWG